MRDTEREAETQAEGEAGSVQGARRGAQSRVSRITPWAGAKPLSHPGIPTNLIFKVRLSSPISVLSKYLTDCQ